jgi:hypothetical protein
VRGQVAGPRSPICAMMNVPPGYPRGAQGELDAPCQCAAAKANNTHTHWPRRAQKTILGERVSARHAECLYNYPFGSEGYHLSQQRPRLLYTKKAREEKKHVTSHFIHDM